MSIYDDLAGTIQNLTTLKPVHRYRIHIDRPALIQFILQFKQSLA